MYQLVGMMPSLIIGPTHPRSVIYAGNHRINQMKEIYMRLC